MLVEYVNDRGGYSDRGRSDNRGGGGGYSDRGRSDNRGEYSDSSQSYRRDDRGYAAASAIPTTAPTSRPSAAVRGV